jgi:hypothetical protein
MSTPTTAQDPRAVLDGTDVPQEVKASAWDAYQQAGDQQDFQSRFDKLQVPREAKAQLWDMKYGAASGVAKAAPQLPPGNQADADFPLTPQAQADYQKIRQNNATNAMDSAIALPKIQGATPTTGNLASGFGVLPRPTIAGRQTAERAEQLKGAPLKRVAPQIPGILPSDLPQDQASFQPTPEQPFVTAGTAQPNVQPEEVPLLTPPAAMTTRPANLGGVMPQESAEVTKRLGEPVLPIGEPVTAAANKINPDEHPVLAALSDAGVVGANVIQGLSSPTNIAILTALATLPEVPGEALALQRVVSLGFSIDQARQAYSDFKQGIDQYKAGNVREGRRLLGSGAVQAVFAAMAGTHAAGPEATGITPQFTRASEALGREGAWQSRPDNPNAPTPQPLGGAYNALPSTNPDKDRELFRNVANDAGANLPENYTREQAEAAFRRANANLRDPRNPAADNPLVGTLTQAYSTVKSGWTDQRPDFTETAPGQLPAHEPSATTEAAQAVPPQAKAEPSDLTPTARGSFIDALKSPITAAPGVIESQPVEATPEMGDSAAVREVPTSSIQRNPAKFQYKLKTDAEGVGSLLKEQTNYNPDLAGVISVWHDPADGKTYVVNGHHRLDLALRTNEPTVTARYLQANNATEARSIGALQNIAEGRGTAIDAAKFMRDSGLTPDDLAAKGISMGEATAKNGVALAGLDDHIFQRLATGEIPEGRAIAVGESTPNHAEQRGLLDLVESQERKGKRVTNDVIRELADFVRGSGKVTETTASLFGDEHVQRSLALEKAEVSAYIKQQLSKDRKLFGFVSKEDRASQLAQAGNQINVEKNKQISEGAAQAEAVYDKLKNYAGPIGSTLESAAQRLAAGENQNVVKQNAYTAIRQSVSETLAGSQGPSADRVQENPEPTLPGFEATPQERAAALGESTGQRLTETATQPGENISSVTGKMERESPLFHDSEASGQSGLFSKPEANFSAALRASAPAQASTTAKKPSAKARKIEAQQQAIIAEAYKPGNVVRGYAGQYDKVLDFKQGEAGKPYPQNHWQVQVIASDKDGNPLPGERPRWHSTPPEKSELAAAQKRLEAKASTTPQAEAHFPTALRSSVFGADIAAQAVGKAVNGLVEQDIAPTLKKLGTNLVTALTELRELITPRAGVSAKTLDTVMKLTGEREKRRFILDQVLQGAEKTMGRLPQGDQIAFVDRFKQGQKQPDSSLQAIADFISKTDEDTYRRVIEAQVRSLSPTARKLWSEKSEPEKSQFLHNIANERERAERALAENEGKLTRGETARLNAITQIADSILDYKENHYRVLWKVIPGSGEEKFAGAFKGSRPLEGSKGFAKQSTLATMSDGVEAGGEPYSYNPVTMFKMAQADSERYITAQNMWNDALDQGARTFTKKGSPTPTGFTKVEDRIGNVKFPASSGEGSIEAGSWYLRDDFARLMNNFLGKDWIRDKAIGRGVLATKNQLTAYRLGLSPFHALTETVSAIGSQVGTGLQNLNFLLRGGGKKAAKAGFSDLATAPLAPVLRYRTGTSAIKYITNKEDFLKTLRGRDFARQYPEIDAMLDRMFASGAKFGLHEDEALHGMEHLKEAWASRDWGNNPLGTSLKLLFRAPFAMNEYLFRPLFNYFIPRVKLGSFLKEYSQGLVDHEADLASGQMTEGQLGRKTWDSIEDMFGQVNWDKFFWKRTLKTAMQIFFRAAQWAAGNVRFTSNAVRGQAAEIADSARYAYSRVNPESGYEAKASTKAIPRLDPNMAKLIGLFITWTAANSLVQLAATHEMPQDAKDLFAGRIGGKDSHGNWRRVTFPAIVFKDALSLWFGGVGKYTSAKISDLVGGIADVLSNRDFAGNMVHNPEDSWWNQRKDDIKHVVGAPIGISNFLRSRHSGETFAQSALGLAGAAPPPRGFDWTPAETKAANYVRNHQGPKTPEQMDELQGYMERKAAGQLMPKEQKSANKSARESFLQHSFKSRDITLNEALDIWSVMSPEETQQNYRELVHRSNTELKKVPYADRPAMRQRVNDALAPKQSALPSFLQKIIATHN